mgnify:CR=1 FL=1
MTLRPGLWPEPMSAKPEEIASSMSLGQAGLAGQNLVRKTSTCVGDILRAQPHVLYIASKFKLASEKFLVSYVRGSRCTWYGARFSDIGRIRASF